jgi:TrmH family RNA methyltransferase
MTPKTPNPKLETRNSKLITSRDNSLLRRARAVRDGKIRESIYIEGLRLGEEALRSGIEIETAIYSQQIAKKDRASSLIRELERVAQKSAAVSEKLLESISYTATPQGLVVLATRPTLTVDQFKQQQPSNPLLVVVHSINNPVNVGAIIRTAEAAGATGVICTGATADPLSPKSLRGAMGSAFRLPIWAGADFRDALAWCAKQGVRSVCAGVHATKAYSDIDWRKPWALVLGSESAGLSERELAAADEIVRIPMKGSVESLNVGVAAGIILYEAFRQRQAA